jgi:hypothetical protein
MQVWGHVYVVKNGGYYKIGYTNGSVVDRMRMIQGNNPVKLLVICTIPTPNAAQLERYLHEEFASKRERGEWYRLTRVDIRSLISRASAGRQAHHAYQTRVIHERAELDSRLAQRRRDGLL